MNKNFPLLIAVIFIISVSQLNCKLDRSGIPHSVGKSSEILVVTDNTGQWNSMIGDSIINFFSREVPGLPQPEPMFTLVNIPVDAFNNVYKKNRNIFIADIDASFEKPVVETKKDLWAKPQRVIKITAATEEGFISEFENNKDVFMELYLRNERERVINAFKSTEKIIIANDLKEQFGIYLTIPSGFNIATKAKDFLWIRKETVEYSQGIIIYTYNYDDTLVFKHENIVSKMDQITKEFIPGSVENSFMQVAHDYNEPVMKRVNFNDNFAVEARGLWKVENDFMGGPFVSYSLVDQRDQKVLTLDAYVYAPGEEKRDLLRQLEAILHTFRFVD